MRLGVAVGQGRGRNEESISEVPAVEHLAGLGYTVVMRETLGVEREPLKDVVLRKVLDVVDKMQPRQSGRSSNRMVFAQAAAQSHEHGTSSVIELRNDARGVANHNPRVVSH